MIAAQGLRRYGFVADADLVSEKFLTLVVEHYRRTGTIVEKYDVARRGVDVSLQFGYRSNEVGFGWTNAGFAALLYGLPTGARARVLSQTAGAAQ